MSSEADKFVFEEALDTPDTDVYFNSKKWNYIVDSTSNNGAFSSQIQFNLQNFSSGQWVDLSQAYIQFPIRTRIYNSGVASQTPLSAGLLSTVLKNGFHHMVDSISIVLDNTTVKMNNIFENVAVQYEILTDWDQNQYEKLAPTLGMSTTLDDFPANSYNAGFNNLPIATLVPNVRGFDLSTSSNTAITNRQYEQNIDCSTTSTVLNSIVGTTNTPLIGKSSTQAVGNIPVATTADAYVQFVLATVRLADLSSAIKNLPPIRNCKGMVYVNYNGGSATFNTSTATIGSWTYASSQGRTMPAMIQNVATTGFQPAVGSNTWTLECTVSGVQSSNLGSAKPPINYARLVAPMYQANADTDSALTQTKKVTYLERFVNNFNILANNSFAGSISTGIVNPKRLILVPYFNPNGQTIGGQALTYSSPWQSPFDTVPATTSVFPIIRNLQVTIGNQQIFANPVNMDYEMFLNEIAQLGNDASMNNEVASGLLNQRLWNSLYRMYSVDISRRALSQDGASVGIQISCDNATNYPLQVFAFVLYEKTFTIETASCVITK